MLIIVSPTPTIKHLLAFCGSSLLIAKYEIIPPISPTKIGNKYHQRERILSEYIVIVENSSPIYFLQVFSEFVLSLFLQSLKDLLSHFVLWKTSLVFQSLLYNRDMHKPILYVHLVLLDSIVLDNKLVLNHNQHNICWLF